MIDDSISTKEAAEILGYSEQYIRSLIRKGDLPATKIAKNWIIPLDAVENYNSKAELITKGIDDHSRRSIKKHKLKALSFFSGAMGLDIGLEKTGINFLLACEIVCKDRQLNISSNRLNQLLLPMVINCSLLAGWDF